MATKPSMTVSAPIDRDRVRLYDVDFDRQLAEPVDDSLDDNGIRRRLSLPRPSGDEVDLDEHPLPASQRLFVVDEFEGS